MKKILIITFIILFALILTVQTHADETCDQEGELCCGAGSSSYCEGTGLACNQELNPNNDPSKMYDDYIYVCRNQDDVADLTTCNEVNEPCCSTTGITNSVINYFCSGLTCDRSNLTCQPESSDLDYSNCSNNGDSCCYRPSGIFQEPYCGPGLNTYETGTSCTCCSPGNDECAPNPTPDNIPILNICEGVSADKIEVCKQCMGDSQDGSKFWTGLGCISTNPKDFIKDFLTIALGVAGGIALLLMIYGSFLISTSAGDPKKAEEGKEMITGTIAGLLFIIFSVFLLKLIGVDILQIPGF